MNTPTSGLRFPRLAAATLLATLASFAMASTTIKVVNQSKLPWNLRITSDPNGPVLVQGNKETHPVEMSKATEILSYRILPGESCTLQFKEVKDKPAAQDIAMVDDKGQEKGHFTLASQPVENRKQLAAGCDLQTASIELPELSKKVSQLQGDDLLNIFGDCWF